MKFKILLHVASWAILVFYTACSPMTALPGVAATASGTSGATNGNGATNGSGASPVSTGQNVMTISMACGYVNEPCVSVTICVPGTTDCQTIKNILVDTGSYGLRVFSSAVSLNLTQETNASGVGLAECVSYADGSSQWGPVKTADVQLGSQTASNVPIQIVQPDYATAPTSCTSLDASAAVAGFNGILGVGLFAEDCGASCVSSSTNRLYFACTGTTCTGSTAAMAKQVTNPVALLATNNNGVILRLPSVPERGANNISGQLILGIGTQNNNTPGAVTTFTADVNGEFKTTFGGASYNAFIDSGSNAYYFPSSSLTQCSGANAGFYCPANTENSSAAQIANTGGTQQSISFNVANTDNLVKTGNAVFNNIAGTMSGYFDWGLPFFLGRTVYVGIQNKVSTLGTGPYWAY